MLPEQGAIFQQFHTPGIRQPFLHLFFIQFPRGGKQRYGKFNVFQFVFHSSTYLHLIHAPPENG